MFRFAFLFSVVVAGQAFAAADCDAAAAKFVKSVPSGPMETLGGKTMAEALLDVENRWFLVAPAYFGAVLVFQKSPESADTELLLSLDTLVDCWQPTDDAGSAKQQKAIASFSETFPPEARLEIRSKAEALQ